MVDGCRGKGKKMNLRVQFKTLAVVSSLAAVLCAIGATGAAAYENVEPGFSLFEVSVSDTRAGGHPDVRINQTDRLDDEQECQSGCLFARRLGVHWPEGFIGNPHVAPTCTRTEFSTSECPVDSQIGIVVTDLGEVAQLTLFSPIYNMEPNPNQAGSLGFKIPFLDFPVYFELSGRTDGDYGLDAVTSPLLRVPFDHFELNFWGVPADPVHNPERFVTPLTAFGACYLIGELGCPPGEPFVSTTFAPPAVPQAPFLQNPPVCGTSLEMTGEVEYFGGAVGKATDDWPEMTGCDQASFEPSLTAKPTTSAADTASGLDTKITVPQTQSPHTPAPSELRGTRVTFPEGFSINPGAADGKLACPEGLNAIGTLLGSTCPEFSKIGSLMLDVAALPAPIPGAMYLAEPLPGEPYRVLLAADGFATHIKLLGRVEPDPHTGRVSIIFDHLPQSPLQVFDLHVFGSERGLLATPTHCGTYQVESEFVPWNSALATRHSTSFITIDSGPNGSPCPNGARPFKPALSAGMSNSTAGSHAPFSLVVTREDGDQNLTGLSVKTPPGFAATFKGIPYCPESAIAQLNAPGYSGVAEQASPACPAASQIGTVTTGAGAGTHPLYVSGKAYLAGSYKGAPLSLVAVVPAVSGPYDLGAVAVRAAIYVDPVTAQATTVSDSLPQILEGIPLRIRYVQVNLDRQDFTLNPTNCDPFSVESSISGDEGGVANPNSRFQASNCDQLNYRPKLTLSLTGGVRRRGHPAIHAVLRAGSNEANSRDITVTLPKGELLDNSHINAPCTRVAFANDACPEESVIGHAKATTPLLDQPIEGNVYLRSSSNDLPDMALDLEGQVNIQAVARIDSVKSRLRTTFETLPDAPLSEVVLDLKGGSKGLLQNSENLCGANKKATTKMVGQNGATFNSKVKLQVACGKARHKRHNNKAVH
jgi:hypothetical protein